MSEFAKSADLLKSLMKRANEQISHKTDPVLPGSSDKDTAALENGTGLAGSGSTTEATAGATNLASTPAQTSVENPASTSLDGGNTAAAAGMKVTQVADGNTKVASFIASLPKIEQRLALRENKLVKVASIMSNLENTSTQESAMFRSNLPVNTGLRKIASVNPHERQAGAQILAVVSGTRAYQNALHKVASVMIHSNILRKIATGEAVDEEAAKAQIEAELAQMPPEVAAQVNDQLEDAAMAELAQQEATEAGVPMEGAVDPAMAEQLAIAEQLVEEIAAETGASPEEIVEVSAQIAEVAADAGMAPEEVAEILAEEVGVADPAAGVDPNAAPAV